MRARSYALRITSLLAVFVVAAGVRTFGYQNTSIDYDELKTIDELRSTNRESLLGYVGVRNLWHYNKVNKHQIAVNNSLSFPLYYIPMKAVSSVRTDLSSLRLATAVWGVIGLVLFFVLGSMYGSHVAWMSFALLLFHPWAQHHTLHIRFYEFWSFLSIAGVLYTKWFIEKIRNHTCTPLHCLLFGGILLLPCTVHAFGIINVTFMAFYTGIALWREKLSLSWLRKYHWFLGGATVILLGAVIGKNLAVFAYTTLFPGESGIGGIRGNSISTLQIWGSFMFNSGYLLPFVITAGILLLRNRGAFEKYRDLGYFSVALVFSLLPVVLITTVNPSPFRSDFLYGCLPYLLLMSALAIDAVGEIAVKRTDAIATKVFLTAVLVVSVLPTFLSNAFIDNDRLPYDVAAADIAPRKGVKVYAPNNNYFNYYLGSARVSGIQNANQSCNDSGVDEYFYIPVRKGMRTQYTHNVASVKDLVLVKILGEDRLDLRRNHIYVFFRKVAVCNTDSTQPIA
jgi:hypothetical protein